MLKNAKLASRPVREPAVAGRFYPSDASELREMIRDMLAATGISNEPAPKVLIAPHAGYVYSGPIAASAYARLAVDRREIRRVILLGPSHFVAFAGLAAPSVQAFATPLGEVPVDTQTIGSLVRMNLVAVLDEAHHREHSLEVQLPFLQMILENFSVVPLVVGEAAPDAVARAIEAAWGGTETRFVISSDLSHYLDYKTATRVDRATADAIEALKPEQIGDEQACGRVPLRGLLTEARRRGLRATTVDLRNSGDTAGSRDQVVGYGAFVLHAPLQSAPAASAQAGP